MKIASFLYLSDGSFKCGGYQVYIHELTNSDAGKFMCMTKIWVCSFLFSGYVVLG